ncbi:MAG: outer membrane protein assembly factor BamD [Deltaproteobacteria bacterium]|nr:outer membrane protein assembly factor BamD [Deltaproteobacteria bacterium]
MKRVWPVLLLSCFFGIAIGCGSGGGKNDPVLALSSQEALEQGRQLLEEEKFFKARRFLSHAFEVAPNTAGGREALLLVADTFYHQGGEANFIQAEAKYRDYLNRFPTSDRAAYVQFQLGSCLAQRTRRADRDQRATAKALLAFQEVLRLYPTTEYAAQARDEIRAVRSQLAEHELGVGKFYINYGLYSAAITRLAGLLEDYPDYTGRDQAYFFLGKAFEKAGVVTNALENYGKLSQEYPDSPLVKKIPNLDDEVIAAAKKAAEVAAAKKAAEEKESKESPESEDPVDTEDGE